MEKEKITIIIITALSVILGPLLIAGWLLQVTGRLIVSAGYLLWLQPRYARAELNVLMDDIKEAWNWK